MERPQKLQCTAFAGSRRIAGGGPKEVALAVKTLLARDQAASVLVFDDATGRAIDLDLRGSDDEAVRRLESHPLYRAASQAPRGPGRPKLGVVSREVTLLPRHWDWLNAQPGGASVTLRWLVEGASRASGGRDRIRQAQQAAYRVASAMAGNEAGYEEAMRALFAGDQARFQRLIAHWPEDVGAYVAELAKNAFPAVSPDDAP
jgi:uncharacterized protein